MKCITQETLTNGLVWRRGPSLSRGTGLIGIIYFRRISSSCSGISDLRDPLPSWTFLMWMYPVAWHRNSKRQTEHLLIGNRCGHWSLLLHYLTNKPWCCVFQIGGPIYLSDLRPQPWVEIVAKKNNSKFSAARKSCV